MLTRFLLLDLETIVDPSADQWLPTIEVDRRLTDEAKIANDLARKKAELLERAPLDADLCRIAAIGWQTDVMPAPASVLVMDETAEAERLEIIWQTVSQTRPMVGYGLSWFDAGVLVRRSQLLGVKVPSAFYKQGKYRHEMIIELGDYLTLNGMIAQQKGRGLEYHCRRFGVCVPDDVSGKDVAALWTAGDYAAVAAHALADIRRIRALAERLDVIPVHVNESVHALAV